MCKRLWIILLYCLQYVVNIFKNYVNYSGKIIFCLRMVGGGGGGCVLICYLNTVYENFYEALKFISVFCAGTNHGGGGDEGNICA